MNGLFEKIFRCPILQPRGNENFFSRVIRDIIKTCLTTYTVAECNIHKTNHADCNTQRTYDNLGADDKHRTSKRKERERESGG